MCLTFTRACMTRRSTRSRASASKTQHSKLLVRWQEMLLSGAPTDIFAVGASLQQWNRRSSSQQVCLISIKGAKLLTNHISVLWFLIFFLGGGGSWGTTMFLKFILNNSFAWISFKPSKIIEISRPWLIWWVSIHDVSNATETLRQYWTDVSVVDGAPVP